MAKILKFPDGFLWGASTSAHQVEGNNHNSWSEWEKRNAHRLPGLAEARWQRWQQGRFPEMSKPQNYISGRSANHHHLFEKDFDLAKSLGHNAHRFSIEWSRIEPEEGRFNQKEIEHYKKVLEALRARGMEPFVTLWHWTTPLWLERKGSWENPVIVEYFEKYVDVLAEALGDVVTFWITLNEPEVFTGHSFRRGVWPPQRKGYFAYRRAIRNLVAAHKCAYSIIKKHSPDAKVGVAKHNIYFEAYKGRMFNRILKYVADKWWNDWFLNKIYGYQDIVTLNHYHHRRINYGFHRNEDKYVSDLGWELYPESLAQAARELAKYKLPIYVTEHGLADADDSRRAWFLHESLMHLHQAMEDGAPVKGYLYWSLLDNFEWDKGFWPRFGLVEVDYETLERKVRSSAQFYKRICETNTLEC